MAATHGEVERVPGFWAEKLQVFFTKNSTPGLSFFGLGLVGQGLGDPCNGHTAFVIVTFLEESKMQ
jgi:hypothetical protein